MLQFLHRHRCGSDYGEEGTVTSAAFRSVGYISPFLFLFFFGSRHHVTVGKTPHVSTRLDLNTETDVHFSCADRLLRSHIWLRCSGGRKD